MIAEASQRQREDRFARRAAPPLPAAHVRPAGAVCPALHLSLCCAVTVHSPTFGLLHVRQQASGPATFGPVSGGGWQ